jgi:hypothetical protein
LLSDARTIAISFGVLPPKIEQEENRAYRDSTIGYVERGKLPAAMVDLNEISDGLMKDAVVHVAGRAA